MPAFEEILQKTLESGGRVAKCLGAPLLIAEGDDQDSLFDKAMAVLVHLGFATMDLRNQSCASALEHFPLPWPSAKMVGRYARCNESDRRLLILLGSTWDRPFWHNLCDDGALGEGSFFRQTDIVVPSNACVLAMTCQRFYENLESRFFSRVVSFDRMAI